MQGRRPPAVRHEVQCPAGLGTGAVASFADLVADPFTQLVLV